MLGRGELNLTPSLKTSSLAQIPILVGCPQTLSTVPMNGKTATNGFPPCLGVPLSCWTPQTTATSYSWQLPPKLVRSLRPFHRHFWYATVTLGSYIPAGDLIRFHCPFHGAFIPRLLTDLDLQVFYTAHPL